jgi:hypothetical protein
MTRHTYDDHEVIKEKTVIFSHIKEAMNNNVNVGEWFNIFLNYFGRLVPYKNGIEAIAG